MYYLCLVSLLSVVSKIFEKFVADFQHGFMVSGLATLDLFKGFDVVWSSCQLAFFACRMVSFDQQYKWI